MKSFSVTDLYWRDQKDKEYVEAINIINKLTEEQKRAVDLLCESFLYKGADEACNPEQR